MRTCGTVTSPSPSTVTLPSCTIAPSDTRIADQVTTVPIGAVKRCRRRGVTSTVSDSGAGRVPHSVGIERVLSVTAQRRAESLTAGSQSIVPLIVPSVSPDATVPLPGASSAEQFENAGQLRLLRKRNSQRRSRFGAMPPGYTKPLWSRLSQ